MTKRFSRLVAYLLALMVTFGILATVSLAQWPITIRGLPKKTKDFNKPPDIREFQPPTNGEYRANPTFFATRNDDERCQAIDLWLSSIRHIASQSASYSGAYYRRNGEELDMARVNVQDVQNFATVYFRNILGKSLPEMSEDDMEKVGRALDKCSHQRWVVGSLENPFRYPVQMRNWIAKFEEIEQSIKKEKLDAQREIYREQDQKLAQETGYPIAELLKGTNAFRLHAAFLNNGYTDWCSPTERQAVTALIHNVDENVAIQNNETYWRNFESEILPAIRAKCPEAEKIYVLNYVWNYFIDYDRNLVSTPANRPTSSDALNIAVYSGGEGEEGQKGWINGDSMAKLGGSTSGRTPRAASFRESHSQAGNENLVNISSVRRFLVASQARLDEEARIRREKEAAAEAARQSEIDRKVKARRAMLAHGGFSTKGLKHEELFANIFLGDFEALPFKRDELSFSTLLGAYLQSFAESCSTALPNNKVEMTRQVCATERVTRNGWGVEIGRSCVEWRTEGTGLFADPAMYSAKSSVDRAQAAKILNPKSGGGILGGILEGLVDLTSGKTLNDMGNAIDVSSDVAPMVRMNVCTGPGLKRFQENLRRFAINERPLEGALTSERTQTSPAKTKLEKPQADIQKSKSTRRRSN
ncbi:MAG: hypothetical protein IPL32_03455 [Chloracidobacterium sp.]|nr:hypothetical protein [Chloracidobacterium sp.]